MGYNSVGDNMGLSCFIDLAVVVSYM